MKKYFLLLSVIFTSQYSSLTWAWGGRGHAAICEAAVFLVKSPQLKEYLMHKPHMMGHLCNIPDIYWRSLPSADRKLGDPGHFINAEKLGLKIGEIPTDYKKIIQTYTGKPNQENQSQTLFSVHDELGSNWWRADQFYRLAVESGKAVMTSPAPKDSKEEQNEQLPYNKAFFQMIVNMGLLGHFVADAGQPFHNSSDYDGYAANQGGIHAFFEESLVAQFGPDLVSLIVKKSNSWNSQPFIEKNSVVENMRALSEVSSGEIKEILKLDPVTKPSILKIEKGMSLKTAAERRPASTIFKKMSPLLTREMARSSYLLAHFWDEIYKKSGEPAIKAYKSFQYPHTPEFIKPDYLNN